MARITKENVNQIITRMTYHRPEKLNDFNTEHTLTKRLKALVALVDAKKDIEEDFHLTDLVDSWYSFCDEDLDDEWTASCYLIKSFYSLDDYDAIWNCHGIGTVNISGAIITESENPFTKRDLKCIVSYFNEKIQKEEKESNVELYTKIKELWLQFYLKQEA